MRGCGDELGSMLRGWFGGACTWRGCLGGRVSEGSVIDLNFVLFFENGELGFCEVAIVRVGELGGRRRCGDFRGRRCLQMVRQSYCRHFGSLLGRLLSRIKGDCLGAHFYFCFIAALRLLAGVRGDIG